METYNSTKNNRTYRVGVGLLILLIGLNFLLRNFGIYTFDWLFSWHTFLLVLGIIIGFRRNFTGGGWLALVLIGGYFTLQAITDMNFGRFALPLGLSILGLYLILSPKVPRLRPRKVKYDQTGLNAPTDPLNPDLEGANTQGMDHDVIDSVNVFSGAHHNIVSKNLKGGEVVSIFGGCDLNLSQSDFEGIIIIDVIAIFGGVKIIIPASWEVKNEVTAVFGGIDDKRAIMPYQGEARKILVLKGVALFGGVDIRNF